MSDTNNQEPINLDLNFAPAWARTSADDYVERYKSDSYKSSQDRGGNRQRYTGSSQNNRDRGEEGGERNNRRDRPYGDRPPRRDDRRPPMQDRNDPLAPRRPPMADVPASAQDKPVAAQGERTYGERYNDRPPMRRDDQRDDRQRRPYREYIQPLDADIRLLPGQKNLGTVMKRIQTTHQAYPLKNFVNLFIDNPGACLVRLEARKENPVTFHQCKKCGFIALNDMDIEQHIMATHFEEYYQPEMITCQPPTGTYNSVNRCTISGEWLGAPNHHSYKHRFAELASRTNLSDDAYNSRVETLRDPESIEAWKQTMTTKRVYRLRIAEQALEAVAPTTEPIEGEVAVESPAEEVIPAIEFDTAEMLFKRDTMPTLMSAASHVCCPVSVAEMTPDLSIKLLLKYTIRNESRSPRSLFFALRGAFRHRKFVLFRANDSRGPEFVTSKQPAILDTEHAVDTLKKAIAYVQENPFCQRRQLMTTLTAGCTEESQIAEVAGQVAWLFSKGNLIEFYNGMLALPAEFPKFRKTPEELGRQAPTTETTEKVATPVATPVVTTTPKATEDSAPEAPVATIDAPAETSPEVVIPEVIAEVEATEAAVADETPKAAEAIETPEDVTKVVAPEAPAPTEPSVEAVAETEVKE